MSKTFKTADKDIIDLSQEELAHEKDRLNYGVASVTGEIDTFATAIGRLTRQLHDLSSRTDLNVLQKASDRSKLSGMIDERQFQIAVRQNSLARLNSRMSEVDSSMGIVGRGIYNDLQSQRAAGKRVSVDLSVPFVTKQDESGVPKSARKTMTDFYKGGAAFFKDQKPIQRFMRGAIRGGGGINLMGGLSALKNVPYIRHVVRGIQAAHAVFKAVDVFADFKRKILSGAQAEYNSTLLSGLDFHAASGLNRAISVRGGSSGEGVSLSGGVARQLGGVRYGQLPQQLMNAAMRFGLKIHGSGYGGMATTDEILADIADKMKDANSMDKEQLAYMASQLGLSAATVRAMEDGSSGFSKTMHLFDGLVDKFGQSAVIRMADDAKFAKEVRDMSQKNLEMNLFGGSLSEKWDLGVANIINLLNNIFGDKIEENKVKAQRQSTVKMLIADYNKTALEGGFKDDLPREYAYRSFIFEEAEKSGLGEETAKQMLRGTLLLKKLEKDVFDGGLTEQIKSAKKKKEEMDSFLEIVGSKGPMSREDRKKYSKHYDELSRQELLAGMNAEYVKNEDGSYRLVNISTGNDGGKVTINGNVVVETNPKNAEELKSDLEAKGREQNSGAIRNSDTGEQ